MRVIGFGLSIAFVLSAIGCFAEDIESEDVQSGADEVRQGKGDSNSVQNPANLDPPAEEEEEDPCAQDGANCQSDTPAPGLDFSYQCTIPSNTPDNEALNDSCPGACGCGDVASDDGALYQCTGSSRVGEWDPPESLNAACCYCF